MAQWIRRRIRPWHGVVIFIGLCIGAFGGVVLPMAVRSGDWHAWLQRAGHVPINGVLLSPDFWRLGDGRRVRVTRSTLLRQYQVVDSSRLGSQYAARRFAMLNGLARVPTWVKRNADASEIATTVGYGVPWTSLIEYCVQNEALDPHLSDDTAFAFMMKMFSGQAVSSRFPPLPAAYSTRWSVAGVAGNALVWAIPFPVVAFAIVGAVAAVRRRWRGKEGACRTCGYEVAGLTSGVCPECGSAIGIACAVVESGR